MWCLCWLGWGLTLLFGFAGLLVLVGYGCFSFGLLVYCGSFCLRGFRGVAVSCVLVVWYLIVLLSIGYYLR